MTVVATLVVLAGVVMLAPAAQAAVDFYANGGLGTFAMQELNKKVDAGNQDCAQLAQDAQRIGATAQCSPAAALGAGLSAEAGASLSAGGILGVSIGYQYLTASTASTLSVQTGSHQGTYTQRYTPTAMGPILKVFFGVPGDLLAARLYAGIGRYEARYVEKGEVRGQVDNPDAVQFTKTYTGKADGYEAGMELRSALGPQAALTAAVGYGWLQVPKTADHQGQAGPQLDFSGLRLRGGLSVSF